jgi:hypothetical protein
MTNPRKVPISLNDDRKPIRLSITNPNPYHLPIAASLASGFILYVLLPDFSKPFEEISQEIPLLFIAASVVIFCLYFLQWSYADNQAAQDREVPDHFYKELTTYIKKYPEHHEYVDQFWYKGMITLREAKLLTDTINHLQEDLHPLANGKNQFLQMLHAKTPHPTPTQSSTPSEKASG